MDIRFEWDARKAARNLRKHGVTFNQAVTVWDDPGGFEIYDAAHSTAEERFWRIGFSDVGVLVIVFTKREGNVHRIISARNASRKERRLYHDKTKEAD